MKRQLSRLFAAALVALSGCGRAKILERFAPADVQEASRKAIGDLETRHFDSLKERLVDELRGRDLGGDFEKMASAFPNERPKAVSLAAFTAATGNGGTRFDISYEYEFSRTWVVARITWVRVNGGLRILNFNVSARDASLEDANAFTFRGKGAVHRLTARKPSGSGLGGIPVVFVVGFC